MINASISRGLGAIYSQEVEGLDCPVLYISRELRGGTTPWRRRACLAIKWVVDALHTTSWGRSSPSV